MNGETLKNLLDRDERYRGLLFIRGFLITNDEKIDANAFPFYGNWKREARDGFQFYSHPLVNVYFADISGGGCVYLIGSAYNPFTMEHREEEILKKIAARFGQSDFFDRVSEITGVFAMGYVKDGKLQVLTDPSGMQSLCCGIANERFYSTSHPQMVADLLGLKTSKFVERLIAYKWYPRVMGCYLPADLTPFDELKRVVPNIEYVYDGVAIRRRRFYPTKELKECANDAEYQTTIEEAATILKNNMELISRKWENPWISLTGGIDSNTTFAAANGLYDRFQTFSYLSVHKETIDVDAARKIANAFDVPWTLYEIPESSDALVDYDLKEKIIAHNNSYVKTNGGKPNELRKRVFLQENFGGSVEVKSWASETIRGYWYKYYGRKTMPRLSAKLFRNLYKIFIWDRKLAREVDRLFVKYIDEFAYRSIPSQYPPADVHYLEVGWGSWGGLNISEMKFYADITIPYNNRVFLDLLFKVPLEKRIADEHHLDMKKFLNKKLYDMNIRVVNMKETKFRAFCLNVIFTINSILPF